MTTTTPRRVKRRVPRIRTTMAHTPVLIMGTRIITKDTREANIMTIIMATAIMDTTMLTASTITASIPTENKYQSIRSVYIILISEVLRYPFRFHRPFQIMMNSHICRQSLKPARLQLQWPRWITRSIEIKHNKSFMLISAFINVSCSIRIFPIYNSTISFFMKINLGDISQYNLKQSCAKTGIFREN